MQRFYSLFIALVSLLFTHASSASADINAELSALLGRYDALAGHFEQTLFNEEGELLQSAAGVFSLQRPGRFRWETTAPFPQLLVSDLNTLWLFDPDLEQVTIRPFSAEASQSPALLLSGAASDIAKHYSVERLVAESHYRLTPLAPNSFTELELVFEQGILAQILVRDSLAQTTQFDFTQLDTTPILAPDLFTFNAPEGVDILIDE